MSSPENPVRFSAAAEEYARVAYVFEVPAYLRATISVVARTQDGVEQATSTINGGVACSIGPIIYEATQKRSGDHVSFTVRGANLDSKAMHASLITETGNVDGRLSVEMGGQCRMEFEYEGALPEGVLQIQSNTGPTGAVGSLRESWANPDLASYRAIIIRFRKSAFSAIDQQTIVGSGQIKDRSLESMLKSFGGLSSGGV